MIQYQEGFISAEALKYIASRLDVPTAHVYSVATFYTMFHLEPIGKFHIQVCTTLSCELCGKEDLLESIEKHLDLKCGESNEMFTISEVECLGACGGAPALAINDDYFEDQTPESIVEILKGLKNDN